MKILICEDEAPASRMLVKMITHIQPDAEILAIVETGEEARNYIEGDAGSKPDLIFMDVELADGPCFETLDEVTVDAPVIFTTAYDEYALKAFRLNSIDYIVKPVSEEDISAAFDKYEHMKEVLAPESQFRFNRELLEEKNYKERFLVKLGRKLFPINSSDIAYFFAHDKMVWLVTRGLKKYIINYTLSDLEELLNPDTFFRLNRQYIAHVEAIKELEPYFKGQVTVSLNPKAEEEIVVSRNKTPELKEWLGGLAVSS